MLCARKRRVYRSPGKKHRSRGNRHDDHGQGPTSRAGREIRRRHAPLLNRRRCRRSPTWTKHLVVVFPDQRITDQGHVAFTAISAIRRSSIRPRSACARPGEGDLPVSNVDDQDRVMPPSAPSQKQLSRRACGTPIELPAPPQRRLAAARTEISRTGGITQFISMYKVYDELPEGLRRQVEGRKARHDFSMLSASWARRRRRRRAGGDAAGGIPWCGAIRQRRKSLYITRSTTTPSKASTNAAQRLIEAERVLGPAEIHVPARMGTDDVLMWDNRCTVTPSPARSHRTPRDAPHDHRRTGRRGGGMLFPLRHPDQGEGQGHGGPILRLLKSSFLHSATLPSG